MVSNKVDSKKVFVHYLDRDRSGKDFDVQGYFEVIEEGEKFLVIKSEKNTIKIPYGRLIKMKGGNN